MKLTNKLDDAIMYSLNKNDYLHLKPNEFIFVPDTCRNLHIKPSNTFYTISIDQLMNFPRGEVKTIIVDKDIKSGYAGNSLVISEPKDENWFLNYLYTDILGVGERIFAPKFDITKYDLTGKPEPPVVDVNKMKKKLDKLTDDNSANLWWFILIVILVIACIIPMCLYIYVNTVD